MQWTDDLREFLAVISPSPWGKAAFVIGSTLILLFLIRLVITKVLWRFAGKTKTDLDDQLLKSFQFPVAVSILALSFWFSLTFFELGSGPKAVLRAVVLTVVIFIWMLGCLSFATYLVEWFSARAGKFPFVQARTKPLFTILTKVVVILCAVYFLILAWGQDLTGFLASAGIVGIAVGFAAKDTLANFFAGIFIIADMPYKIGDYVILGDGDRGRVTDIGLRSTRLLTRDDVEVIVPNAIIGNREIINQSGGPYEKFRMRVAVSVAYGSDIDQVREVLLRVAAEDTGVADDPEARVRFRSFGDSGLNFELLVWVNSPELKGQTMDRLLSAIYKSFGAAGIEIPYNKMDVYLYPRKDKLSE